MQLLTFASWKVSTCEWYYIGDFTKAVVERFFCEAINDRKLEILAEIISPDFRGNILEYEQTWNTREKIAEMLGNVFVAFPDYHQVIHDWIVQGDKVVACWTTVLLPHFPLSRL